jgi:galactose mutarotase-like enzyme
MQSKITLSNSNGIVIIEKGELISFTVNNIEYIHQKGNKGWRNSDDEMFPVIGPTVKNNFKVHTKNGDAIQDQHGLLRELDYETVSFNENSATFIKKYTNNTPVLNSKFPDKSTELYLHWPFDFTFEKIFTIKNNMLTIDFVINSDINMPFMLGYHPAFLLSNTGKETFVANGNKYTLDDVYKAGSNAFPILNTNTITLKNLHKNNIEIATKGFNNFMLWTEVDNMVCIEPITQYTSYTNQKFSEENMSLSRGKNMFSIQINIV